MSRIIINNLSGLTDIQAVERVHRVCLIGKISRMRNQLCFCFATSFQDCDVIATLTDKGSHSFTVTKRKD